MKFKCVLDVRCKLATENSGMLFKDCEQEFEAVTCRAVLNKARKWMYANNYNALNCNNVANVYVRKIKCCDEFYEYFGAYSLNEY